MLKIFLIVLGSVGALGLIRIMIKHPDTFLEAILDMFFLDLLIDLISEIDW